jgi:hypothetical protein
LPAGASSLPFACGTTVSDAAVEIAFDPALAVGAQLRAQRRGRDVLVERERLERDVGARREVGIFDARLRREALPQVRGARKLELDTLAVGARSPRAGRAECNCRPDFDAGLLELDRGIGRELEQGARSGLHCCAIGSQRIERSIAAGSSPALRQAGWSASSG